MISCRMCRASRIDSIGGADPGARRGGDPGGRDGLDRVHVPQPALGLLEVGFEQERQLAEDPGPLVVQVAQFGQPGPGGSPPVFQGALAQLGRQCRVTRDVPGAEQAEGHLDVGSCHPAGLGHGPDRVVQPCPGVPDRVPDAVRDRRDAVPSRVQQENVQITAGQQLAAAVTAHRDQRDPGLGAQHAGEPAICFGSPASAIRSERRHQGHRVPPYVHE